MGSDKLENMLYLAILGQNKYLSLAELFARYPDIKIKILGEETVVLDSDKKIALEKLGGLPKLAILLKSEPLTAEEAKGEIIKNLTAVGKDKKIFFGLSFYHNYDRNLYNRLGREIKKELKNAGWRARWVISKAMALTSVIIKTNKLLTSGADYNFFFWQNKIYLAKTAAIQDFADYEFRDMGRPARDLISGIMSPKLAKILINLASPSSQKEEEKGNFLDPFCGSGTILSEAALLGFKKIHGSDISEKAVSESKKNFSWLTEKYNLPQKPEIKICDIKNISECWRKKFDSIATEPYLGPPIRGRLRSARAEKLQKELSGLYEIYLKNLSSVLDKNGTLVLIVPFFFAGEKIFKISLKIKENGLTAARAPILYSRPDQKIGREIYILKKI